MMATEAISDNIATTSLPNVELIQSNDVPTELLVSAESAKPLVNGNAEHDNPTGSSAVAEDAAISITAQNDGTNESVPEHAGSAEVSVSEGSDTEKAAAEKGHTRTSSTVKKFASFKPVSVNKTFLAAKGATSAAPKPGDKPASTPAQTPSTLVAPRPRLVAKTASGLRDSAPRSSTTGTGGNAAPDANAVWNKNRPAPPPEPKRFTDEELKQRYGIHLATRLQTDDPAGKQANWADIDDDDDDWAPETIEWTDGTKITLPQADEAPPVAPEPSPSPALKDVKSLNIAKPKSPAPTQASASPTTRPSVFGSGRAGLVLKGASEKPTLVAKPPGPPTPVKSPWASLPPVEKVAPIAIEVSQQNPQPPPSRFGQRDPHGFQGMPPPAKEIAADDFSRTWRDSPANSRPELYNSQSGRYEPVNDNRRGSVRNDPHSRGPAVLHRPSHQDGHAEPSAAFQTHRAGGQDSVGYGRRRTSSNVSGGSGAFARRMSRGHDMLPPHEMLNARRGSLAAVSDDPSSPRNFSPSGQAQSQRGYQNSQGHSRDSPVNSHTSPQSIHAQPIPQASSIEGQSQPTSAVVQEDPIEAQKKIMRATRELAIKRRQEEEAREEAARKERIRLKLEAMGPPPEKKSKKETPNGEKSVPVQIQTRDTSEAVAGEAGGRVADISHAKLPDRSNELANASVLGSTTSEPQASASEQRSNGTHQGSTPSVAASNHASQDNRNSQQSWQNNSASNDRFSSWNAASAQQSSSRNVWGPPTNDKTLGNGTFNPELSRLPDMTQSSSQSSSHPGPIGPPNANRGNGQHQQGRGREYGSRPAPIAPPTRQPAGPRNIDPRVAASGWATAPQRIQAEDRQLAQKQEAELRQKRELEAAGLAPEVHQPVFHDTWRQVIINEDGTRSKVVANHKTVIDAKGMSSAVNTHDEVVSRPVFDDRRLDVIGRQEPPSQYGTDAWKSANAKSSPPVRGSRFFPNNNRDVRLEESQFTFERPGSPTPPPPTMAGHPAYDGDIAHPHVSLPRPAPVVKLPPAMAPIGPPKPVSFAAAVTAPAVPVSNNFQGRQDYGSKPPHQDVRRDQPTSSGGWQDRISSLLGRKNSPPKSHALAVDSSSKSALELPTSQFVATVSLPSSVTGDLAADDHAVLSKPAAEECFEEQEMGSFPRIKVPNYAPQNGWNLAAQPKPMPRKFLVSHVTSADPVQFAQQIVHNGSSLAISILLPGQTDVKTVNIPNARQRSNPRRGASRGTSRNGSSSHPRGGRGRDSSGGFPSPRMDNASVSSSPTSRGGLRGNGRGYSGSNWNRHVSTPVHT